MTFQPIDHQAEAETRYLAQYAQQPNWLSLVAALMPQIQGIEDALAQLPAARRLATATGENLDEVGGLIGLGRNGLDDTSYRLLLVGEIIEQHSDGTIGALESAATALFEAKSVQVRSAAMGEQPCSVYLEIGSPALDPTLFPLVISIFRKALAAAVTLRDVETYADADEFRLAGGGPGKGLGSATDPSVGGQLAASVFATA